MEGWNLRGRGITDERVLVAMRETPREAFVPEDVRHQACGDHPLPIGHGQTISQPYIVAAMTQLLRLRQNHRVLEIGTGSGYQTAILAAIAQHVYSIELISSLHKGAKATLADLQISNISFRLGDGYAGWPEQAPFDAIILTAAPESLPQALVDQLAVGGRMVAPVGSQGRVQSLQLVERTERGIGQRHTMDVSFVPMVHPHQ